MCIGAENPHFAILFSTQITPSLHRGTLKTLACCNSTSSPSLLCVSGSRPRGQTHLPQACGPFSTLEKPFRAKLCKIGPPALQMCKSPAEDLGTDGCLSPPTHRGLKTKVKYQISAALCLKSSGRWTRHSGTAAAP